MVAKVQNLSQIRELIDSGRRKEGWEALNHYLVNHPEDAEAWDLAIDLAKPEAKEKLRRRAKMHVKDTRSEVLKSLDASLGFNPQTGEWNSRSEPRQEFRAYSHATGLHLASCKACEREVAVSAPSCPHCGVTLPAIRIQCGRCGQTRVRVQEQSFNLGSSVIGGLLIGPVGFLSGFFGNKPLEAVCENCGHKSPIRS